MGHIFVSYSHKNVNYAQELAEKLQSEGFEVWIDERLDYGSQWPIELQRRLDTCDAFILIMSPDSFVSDWVQSELSRAKRKNKPIFPLLLEGDEPWLSVESTQYFDVRGEKVPDKKFYNALERVVTRDQTAALSSPTNIRKSPVTKPVSPPKYRTAIMVAIIGGIAILIAAMVPVIWSKLSPSPTSAQTPFVPVTSPSSTPTVPLATTSHETAAVQPTIANLPRIDAFQACPTPCDGHNSTNNFASGITKIYLQFNYENFGPGVPYTRTWTMDGREWARYMCKWDGPASGTELLKLTEPKGLASGTWKIEVTVDNKVLLEEEIVIVGNGKYWDPVGVINACHGTN